MTTGVLIKNTIEDLFIAFNKFQVTPRSTIPTIDDIIAPGVHLIILIDQDRNVVLRNGSLSHDDKSSIADDVTKTDLFKLLKMSKLPFAIVLEICHLTNSVKTEVLIGTNLCALKVKKKCIK